MSQLTCLLDRAKIGLPIMKTILSSESIWEDPTRMRRSVRGSLGGGVLGALIGGCVALIILGVQYRVENARPIYYARYDLAWLPNDIAYCMSLGAILGALAGFASRLPTSGVPFLRCFFFIALAAFVVRLFTMPPSKGTDYSSHLASFVAAVVLTRMLIRIGTNRGREIREEGLPT